MADIKVALLCCRLNFLKWRRNSKILMLALIVMTILGMQTFRVRTAAATKGMSLSAWFFPNIVSSVMIIAYVFVLIVLFNNSPFLDNQSFAVLSRTSRGTWFAGQVLYTLAVPLVLMVFSFVVFILFLLPYVDFSNQWSTLTRGIVNGNVGTNALLTVNEGLKNSPPISGFALYMLIHWLLGCFIGVLCLFLNLAIRIGVGSVAVSILATTSYFINIFPPAKYILYASPISWYDIGLVNYSGEAYSIFGMSYSIPSAAYVLIFLTAGTVLLTALSASMFKTADLYAIDKEKSI